MPVILARVLLELGLEGHRALVEALPVAVFDCQLEIRDHVMRRIVSWEDHFLGPLGTPAFVLLQGSCELLGLREPDDPRLAAACEAMVCAYMAVRIQDERIDDDVNPTWSFVEQVYVSRLARLLVDAAGGDIAYLDRWHAQVVDFADAAIVDDGIRATPLAAWSPEQIRLQGRKFLPMLAPLAALAWGAGRPELEEPLGHVVCELGIALQLANDLQNAASDLRADRTSPYLQRLGLMPGRDAVADLGPARIRAFGDHELSLYLAELMLHLRAAGQQLARLGSEALSAHVLRAGPQIQDEALVLITRSLRAGLGAR